MKRDEQRGVHKQELLLAASLLLRVGYGAGTPRGLADRQRPAQPGTLALLETLWVLLSTLFAGLSRPWRPRPVLGGALPLRLCAA